MEDHDDHSKILSRGEWRDSTLAEYAKLPLENCHILDQDRLMGPPNEGGLGYNLEDLTHLLGMLIPFGGLADMGVKAGETIIVAPATGRYGSAAVHLSLALGARVIAIGRNAEIISQLATISPRVTSVRMTGDLEADTKSLKASVPNGADCFFDMSPTLASKSTHFRATLEVMKLGGCVNLMGFIVEGVAFSYMDILERRLTFMGSWLSTRDQTIRLIAIAEAGLLPLGSKAAMGPVRSFGLDQWKEQQRGGSPVRLSSSLEAGNPS